MGKGPEGFSVLHHPRNCAMHTAHDRVIRRTRVTPTGRVFLKLRYNCGACETLPVSRSTVYQFYKLNMTGDGSEVAKRQRIAEGRKKVATLKLPNRNALFCSRRDGVKRRIKFEGIVGDVG